MLQNTVSQMPSWDGTRHTLPRVHVLVPMNQGLTESGLCHAVITIDSRDLREALTIREVARQTPVPVPRDIDTRGWRYASTWWMQPRGEKARNTWQATVSV